MKYHKPREIGSSDISQFPESRVGVLASNKAALVALALTSALQGAEAASVTFEELVNQPIAWDAIGTGNPLTDVTTFDGYIGLADGRIITGPGTLMPLSDIPDASGGSRVLSTPGYEVIFNINLDGVIQQFGLDIASKDPYYGSLKDPNGVDAGFGYDETSNTYNITGSLGWKLEHIEGATPAVPEPGAYALMLGGLAGVAGATALRRRRD